MTALRRFVSPLVREKLADVLDGVRLESEDLPSGTPADAVHRAVAELPEELVGPEIDRALLEPLHRALAGITHREAADMRLWHHMATVDFPEIVWRRWKRGVPEASELRNQLDRAMYAHFAGRSTLNGVSRNTFARLWWLAESVASDGDYGRARKALERQDMFVAAFERLTGLCAPARDAYIDRMAGRSEDEGREAAKWLAQTAVTTVLDSLNRDQVAEILDEALESEEGEGSKA
jgi:hypothetical protein